MWLRSICISNYSPLTETLPVIIIPGITVFIIRCNPICSAGRIYIVVIPIVILSITLDILWLGSDGPIIVTATGIVSSCRPVWTLVYVAGKIIVSSTIGVVGRPSSPINPSPIRRIISGIGTANHSTAVPVNITVVIIAPI